MMSIVIRRQLSQFHGPRVIYIWSNWTCRPTDTLVKTQNGDNRDLGSGMCPSDSTRLQSFMSQHTLLFRLWMSLKNLYYIPALLDYLIHLPFTFFKLS